MGSYKRLLTSAKTMVLLRVVRSRSTAGASDWDSGRAGPLEAAGGWLEEMDGADGASAEPPQPASGRRAVRAARRAERVCFFIRAPRL